MLSSSQKNLDLWQESQFRIYLGEVRRKCGVVETLALPSLRDLPSIHIETLFVPPLLCDVPVHADSDPGKWPAGQNLLSELQEFGQLVVLGDPGGGKTTLSNWLAWRLTSGSTAPLPAFLKNKIPFPCILREMPDYCFERGFSVDDLSFTIVSKLLGEKKAEQLFPTLRTWIETGNYALILDGIDEVSVPRRQIIASWIREANRHNAVLLATSRIVGYEDFSVDSEVLSPDQGTTESLFKNEKVRKRVRPADPSNQPPTPNKGREWAKLRYLMPFNQLQISDFARNWYSQRCVSDHEAKQKTSDLLASLAQSEITQRLARTPNLLSLMAIVHRERAHLPDGKALLYEEIVNAYINTIDLQRKIGAETTLSSFGWKEKKSWLAYVGFKLQEFRGWGSLTTGILATEEQVVGWLEEAIQQSEVFDSRSVAKEFLSWVARRSGLLLPRGENQYAFVHLSFQEYFCAYYLGSCIVRPAFVTNSLAPDALVTKAKLEQWATHPAWLEAFIFLFESLSAEHGSEWVEALIQIVFDDFDASLASLAARLIKNKHVKLPSHFRDSLAEFCVAAIFNEASFKPAPDSEIFRTLMEAGYAALITDQAIKRQDTQSFPTYPLSKVKILIVSSGATIDKSYLAKFQNLLGMSVVNSNIDLSGLSNTPKLLHLRLINSKVLGYENIALQKNLGALELREIDIADINPLSHLRKLTMLELSDLNITDLSPLETLTSITYLDIGSVAVEDLSPIGKLKKLDALFLSKIPAKDLSFIENLRALDCLQVSELDFANLTSLSKCKKLTHLDVSSVYDIDLTPIIGLSKLSSVFLANIKSCDLSILEMAKNIAVLMFENMSINSLSESSALKRLKSVYLKNIELDSYKPLNAFSSVRVFSILGTSKIKDLSFIASFKKLDYLDLRDIPIEDISPLQKLRRPFTLRLSSNHQYDVSFMEKEGFKVVLGGFDDNNEDN
nr:NACHT domain-containing protein [Pseudomonas viridiflava]